MELEVNKYILQYYSMINKVYDIYLHIYWGIVPVSNVSNIQDQPHLWQLKHKQHYVMSFILKTSSRQYTGYSCHQREEILHILSTHNCIQNKFFCFSTSLHFLTFPLINQLTTYFFNCLYFLSYYRIFCVEIQLLLEEIYFCNNFSRKRYSTSWCF